MATKRTSVVLNRERDIGKENDDRKRKTNKIKNKRNLIGAGTYKTKYCSSWESDYPDKAVKGDIYKYFCVSWRKTLSCQHHGLADVKLHCGRDSQIILNTHDKNNAKAEAKVVNFLVQHNLPLAVADYLGSYLRTYFLTVKVSSYVYGRAKTSAILNQTLAPSCKKYVAEHCKSHPFTLGTNGSNDRESEPYNDQNF